MNSLGEILSILNDQDSKYIYNEQYDGFETSKIFYNGASFKHEEEKVANDNILVWMNQFSVAGDDHDEDKNILRVVWIRRDVTNESCHFEIIKENEDCVLKRFDLKGIYQVVGDGAFICSPMKDVQHSKKQRFAFGISGHVAVLAWTYNLTTAQTEAVCWSSDFIPASVMRTVLEHQKRLARHSMFLAFTIAICISQSIQHFAESIRYTINKVENRTQHCHLGLRSRDVAEGSYTSLSAMMSASVTHLANLEGRAEALQKNLETISAYQWPSGVDRPKWAETVFSAVDECVQIMKNRQKGQKIRIRYLTRRAEIQSTTLFHLITQQETRLSILVAQDSRTLATATKHDSTAMKTLAAVTVFFLPGTFVAAFFSMPLFRWDERTLGPHSALSRQFWVYWVVTVPLTVLTVTLWFAWMHLQMKWHRARDAKGRDELDLEFDSAEMRVSNS